MYQLGLLLHHVIGCYSYTDYLTHCARLSHQFTGIHLLLGGEGHWECKAACQRTQKMCLKLPTLPPLPHKAVRTG